MSSVALAAPPPVVVIGLDGADPRVVRELWSRKELPALRALADRGFFTELGSAYKAESPVVWTTVATGRAPEDHGIETFISTAGTNPDDANAPVSSRDRQVPALWDMATRSHRRALVLGWWATWPVTPLDGFMLSDRPAPIARADYVAPDVPAATWARRVADAEAKYGDSYPGDAFVAPVDRLVTASAVRELPAGGYGLGLVYLRRIDVVAHHHWHGFEPIPGNDPADTARSRDALFAAYRAVDRSIGDVVAAAPAGTRFLVLSDHGFHLVADETRVRMDIGRVLAALGLLGRQGREVDLTRTQLVDLPGDNSLAVKELRASVAGRDPGGIVPAAQLEALLASGRQRLESVTYVPSGERVFEVERAPPGDRADLRVTVRRGTFASTSLLVEGRRVDDAVIKVWRNTGGHVHEPPGILIAAGPGIGHTPPRSPSVKDVAPTVLQWLDLPIGADMIGRPWVEVRTDGDTAVETIPTWGAAATESGTPDASDEDVMRLLRDLCYVE